ncbi:WD40 repeat domain-containing serine/threonine protein kinase [Nocardiopsis oceani]
MTPPHDGPPEWIGRYRIVTTLGSGGMGHVYLGLGAGNQPLAIKVVRPEFAYEPDFRERFAREVHRALQVTGGDLPRVLDADTTGSEPWLATEFVLGPSLQEMVRRVGALPEFTAAHMGRAIARTLAHLHSTGVVHRDLKPGNVLVSAPGPRVIDLGISRAMDEAPGGETPEFAGTPGYMAPETARGDESGPAADVFALGAVLVFALTGRSPFGDGHPSAVLYRIGNQDPDLDGVPEPLVGLLTACLDKDPARRPRADQVLQALGGPVPPVPGAGAWLPQTAVAVLDGFEHDHRAAVRPYLEAPPAPPKKGTKGRTLALVGAAATALVLVAGAGVWAVTDGDFLQSASEEEEEDEPGRKQCDPAVHLAPEYVEAADAEPTLPEDASSVRFSSDGSVLAVQRQDGVVSLWDWEERTALADVPVPTDAYRPVVFSPNDCYIGLGSDQGAHIISLETGEHTRHFNDRSVRSVAFTPDSRSVLLADDSTRDDSGGVYPLDLDTGEVSEHYTTDAARNLRYSPEGTRVAGMTGYSLTVWDADSQEELFDSGWLSWGDWNELSFLDEDSVLAIHEDGPVVFDLESGEGIQYEPDNEPEGDLIKVEANPVHDLLYAVYMTEADEDGMSYLSARVWHRSTAEDRTPDEDEDILPFVLLTVHPEGEVLASLSESLDEIRIMDAVTMETIDTFD